jgi:RNA polymerase sigma-32 factor
MSNEHAGIGSTVEAPASTKSGRPYRLGPARAGLRPAKTTSLHAGRGDYLDAAAERALLEAWLTRGDHAARNALVLEHMPYVHRLARHYTKWGVPEEELVNEGLIGLMEAIDRFDLGKPVRLITFASWRVWSAMQDFVALERNCVQMLASSQVRHTVCAAIQIMRRMQSTNIGRHEISMEDHETLERAERFFRGVFSLNDNLPGLPPDITLGDTIPALVPTPEEAATSRHDAQLVREFLDEALLDLDERERTIIRKRIELDDDANLREIGEAIGVSGERARQLQTVALEKLKAWVVKCPALLDLLEITVIEPPFGRAGSEDDLQTLAA